MIVRYHRRRLKVDARSFHTNAQSHNEKKKHFHLKLLSQSVDVSVKSKILLVGAVRVCIMKKVPDANATKIRSNDEH